MESHITSACTAANFIWETFALLANNCQKRLPHESFMPSWPRLLQCNFGTTKWEVSTPSQACAESCCHVILSVLAASVASLTLWALVLQALYDPSASAPRILRCTMFGCQHYIVNWRYELETSPGGNMSVYLHINLTILPLLCQSAHAVLPLVLHKYFWHCVQ